MLLVHSAPQRPSPISIKKHPAEAYAQAFLFWRKVKWMMMALFGPEVLLAKAVTDLRSCLLHSPMLKELADEDGVPWSKAHTFLADMGGFALRFTPSSNFPECQSPSAPSADVVKPRPSPKEIPANTAKEGQSDIVATEEDQDQIRAQESGGSPPDQPRTRKSQSQDRLAVIQTHDSAEITHKNQPHPDKRATSGHDSITQRKLVNESSPDVDLTKLEPTTEQYNRQAVTSEEQARQQLQPATPGNGAVISWNQRRASRNRREFRARIKNDSQHFGDIMWRAFTHHEITSTEVCSESTANFPERGHPRSVLSTLLTFEGDVWVLTAAQLIEARRRKLIVRLPYLTEDEVSDRDKGDLLLKLLALLQVSWMVIQIIARAILHISSTPLEIMTLSFAACTFITYILFLNHPQDVATSIYIDASRPSTVNDMREIADLSSTCYWFARNRLPCISNNSIHWNMREGRAISERLFTCSLGAGAAVFGGAHLVAWNFVFPTAIERTLWRTSSLVTLLGPLVTAVVTLLSNILIRRFRGRPIQYSRDRWLQAFTRLSMLALVLARLFVIVEAFRSLYYLPQDAYLATWAANSPYIA